MYAISKQSEFRLLCKYWDIYSFLAFQDINSRFRGSKLGVMWIVMQQLITSLGAGFIWCKVFNLKAQDFVPFLALGFAIWNFIASAVIEGGQVLITAHGYLKQLPLAHSIFIFRALLTNTVYFLINFFTACCILAFYNQLHWVGFIKMLPGIFILLLYFYGAAGSMGYLSIRYRDLQHALPGVFSLLFMVTPVLYPPEILLQKGIPFTLYLNPFASLIEIIRCPLLTSEFAPSINYIISILSVLCAISIRFLLEKKWGQKVAFWS